MMSSPEQKLKRFLHYGREIPVYQPGDRFLNDLYQPLELSSIDALIAAEKSSDAAACIVKAFSDGYSAHPEMLVYALALCVKQQTNVQLTAAAYKAAKTVCASPENLFLFIKFASKLSPKHKVWGSGFRKMVKEWYLKKDPKVLAEIVTRRKRYHGWSHKDLIKGVHLKAEDPAKAAIIKYILFDIATAKKEYGEIPGTSEILNYIQAVEDFKHMTDEQQAARTLESLHLTLDHIPSHLSKSKEIWSSLIGILPLGILIKNLERIGYLGFLKSNSPLVTKVLDALHDERLIAESNLHPAKVFIALRKYETSSKFTAAENAQKKQKTENGSGEARKVVKVPPKPNTRIVIALHELFSSTCKLFLAPTGLRYMVGIDLKFYDLTRTSEKCYRCPNVTPPQAAVVTTLCLLHADRNVTVCGLYPTKGVIPISLLSTMTIQQGVEKLSEFFTSNALAGHMSPSSLIKYAELNKEEYDVFLYITDYVSVGDQCSSIDFNALNEYRTSKNSPKTKWINLHLTCHLEPTSATASNDPGIFEISGFDGNVPRIIEAFSRGAF